MNIAKNKVVSLIYELRAENKDGEIIETVEESNPLTFIFGIGQLLPKFESNIVDKLVGDNFAFDLTCDEAYGPLNQDAIIDLPLNIFEVDGKIDEELLAVGNIVPMRDETGNRLNGKVVEVKDSNVVMDFNHPLAGSGLHFNGKITDVREATEEELQHGHIHSDEACNCESGDCGSNEGNGDCGCGCGCH
jgi:FKBP-type peptidyl-prolyl cis-trans isomerase SlyD